MNDRNREPFANQFVLDRDGLSAPGEFERRRFGDWVLATGANLPVTELTTGGAQVGWLLGWAVLPGGGFADDHASLELPHPDEHRAFEDSLYELAGRWLCIVAAGVRPRAYLDPGGSLAAVFAPDRNRFASTTTLAQDDPAARPARPRVLPNQWYPLGETSDPGVRRLLPNHTLDLSTWEVSRHWPVEPIERVAESDVEGITAQIDLIASSLARVIGELATRAPLVLPLTAGHDSRMLLATARDVMTRVEFVTYDYGDSRKSDVSFARWFARDRGLKHTVLPLRPAVAEAREEYLRAVGHDASDGKTRDTRLAAALIPSDRGWVTGFAGEVGRAFYWRKPGEVLGARDLIERMRLSVTDSRIAAMKTWLDSLPDGDTEFVLDLMYLEQRNGGWVSPQTYGAAGFEFNIYPMNQRAVLTAMLRLPVEYRRRKRMPPAVVRSAWPELARYPIGRVPGLRGRWHQGRTLALKVVERARSIVRRRWSTLVKSRRADS